MTAKVNMYPRGRRTGYRPLQADCEWHRRAQSPHAPICCWLLWWRGMARNSGNCQIKL